MNQSRAARRTVSRTVALAALACGTAWPALADDLTISTAQTTPVATATAANNSPGNITISAAGSLSVTSGTAATINSNNILTSTGSITNSGTTGAIGVLLDGTGGRSESFINTAAIGLTGTAGSGSIGLSVAGGPVTGAISSSTLSSIAVAGDGALGVSIAAPFIGNISLNSVSVTGTNSTAISVTAPVTGNISLTGTSGSSAAGGYALLVTAPVSGTISNAATLNAGTTAGLDSNGATVAGLIALGGVRISSSVGGGFVNDRYYIDTTGAVVPAASVDTTVDSLITGFITSSGTAPTIWIAPDAANPQPITLGAVGSGSDAFAFINRGTIRVNPGNAGTSTTAILVGGGGATTTLAGGISNQATGLIYGTSTDADTTGLSLRAGAIVPQIQNLGTISVAAAQSASTSSTPTGPGGNAVTIDIAAGASVPSLVNTGTLTAVASGASHNATVIRDASGSLASIVNTGIITAQATGTGGLARAIDLSATTAPVTVSNSGAITGDILFGSGATTLQLTGGTIAGTVAFGSGSSLLAMSGTSVLGGTITSGAPIAITLTDTAALNLVSGPATINSIAATGNSVLTLGVRSGAPALSVNGTASFTGASTIELSLQSLALNQDITIISAAGGFSTDHLATLVNGTVSPYLFTASAPTVTATSIGISLTRKSAAEIGLTGGQAGLYTQSIAALGAGSPEAAAIANLPSQAAVVAAYRQITPPSFGRAPLVVAQGFADAGFGATADRLAAVSDLRQNHAEGWGIWGQEIGDFAKRAAGPNETAFSTSTLGIAAGIDTPLLGLDAVGVALLSSWSSIKQKSAPGYADVPLDVSTQGIEPYASWSWKQFFVEGTALAAIVSYNSSRTLLIDSLTDSIGAHWKGSQFGASLTLGGRFHAGRIRLTPTNTLSWTELTQNAYAETGGGAFDLAVAKQKDTALSNTSRLSIQYRMPFGAGTIYGEAHGAYVHQFRASPTQTLAQFITGGDAVMMTGDAERAEQVSYGGGVGYDQDGFKVGFGYDRRQSTGFHDQALALTAAALF